MILKSDAKVLLRSIVLSGGAPKSAFQYMNIFKQNGHHVTAILQENEGTLKNQYEQAFDRVVLERDFNDYIMRHDYFGLYRQLSKEYIALKASKPDIAFLLGHPNSHFYSRFCSSLNIPNVTIIAGGSLGKKGAVWMENNPCDHVICFSEENRDDLLSVIDDERITVISNRIKLKKQFDDLDRHYSFDSEKQINLLLTSRVSKDKYDSIVNFTNMANSIACPERKIVLTIAGGGDMLESLREHVESFNNPDFEVILKGHVDDLIPEFEKAHIVVGKGRSVIEPMMMGRAGCVIGDDGKLEVCSKENFERVYHYNFSGRQLVGDSPDAVLSELIDSILKCEYDVSTVKSFAELLKLHYSEEYLPEKLYSVLENMKPYPKKIKHISILSLMLNVFRLKLKQRKVGK